MFLQIYCCICFSSYLLLLFLSGDVAPFNLPVTKEVTEVAKDGQDAVAHVCEHCHHHGGLFKVLDEGPAVQPAVVWRCIDLSKSENVQKQVV